VGSGGEGVLTKVVWDEGVEGWISVMCERGEVGGGGCDGWVGRAVCRRYDGGTDGVVVNNVDAGGRLTVSELSVVPPGLPFSVMVGGVE
jgi:hypothetical protein